MPNTYTTNYNLAKPAQGDVNWDDEINGNFDILDAIIADLEQILENHLTDNNNPHQVTYAQVGAAPASHLHQGSDIVGQVAQAANADRVDNIHLRTEDNLLYFSTDNINWIVAGEMTKAVYDQDNDGVVDNADRTDGIHFRVQNNVLEFSTDGVSWLVAGEMTKAVYDANNNGVVDNAEQVGGYSPSTTATANTVAVRDSNGDLTARVLKSSVATGTAPIQVSSTTTCTNLNADMVDGQHASAFLLLDNTSSVSINVPSGQTINFQTGGTTRAYVNDYGLVGAVYNSDIAEGFVVSTDTMPEDGDIMVIHRDGTINTLRGKGTYLGIVSYRPGILLGMTHNWQREFEENRKVPIAIMGQVRTNVSGGWFGVKPGDYLTVGKDNTLRKRRFFWERVVAIALEPVPKGKKERIKVLLHQ